MGDFAGPSFSLGFDLDFDEAEPNLDFSANEERFDDGIGRTAKPEAASSSRCTFLSGMGEEEGRFREETLGEYPPERETPLRRLRKGSRQKSSPCDLSTPNTAARFPDLDDDIEEFSSQEDCVIRDALSSRQIHSSCSSSKVPLHGRRILTTLNSKKSKPPNISFTPSTSIPTSVEASSNKKVFPRITLSPLKRIHLLDSDSEGNSIDEERSEISAVNRVNPAKLFNIETPAFDQFCEEQFQPLKTKCQSQQPNIQDNRPPCHEYFFHPDIRIQNIVRRRLPNFNPIGSSQQINSDILDYMGQFGETKKPSVSKGADHETSTKGRSQKRKNGKGIKASGKAGISVAIPKDVVKKRVSAVASCGHWYTGDNGRKVYVTKNGQELTGQIAYRQHRKDKGGRKKSVKRVSGNSKKSPRNDV